MTTPLSDTCRKLPEQLTKLAASPEAVFVPLHKGLNLVTSAPSQLSIFLAGSPHPSAHTPPDGTPARTWHPALLQRHEVAHLSNTNVGHIFLGMAPRQRGVFAVAVRDDDSAQELLQGASAAAEVSRPPQQLVWMHMVMQARR